VFLAWNHSEVASFFEAEHEPGVEAKMGGMHFEPADSSRGNATKRAKKAPAAPTWTMEKSIADSFDARTFANMEVALERACESFGPRREQHEARRYIASKILECAQGGDKTLTGLTEAGLVAATELSCTHGA
jgi:hypothetical protein